MGATRLVAVSVGRMAEAYIIDAVRTPVGRRGGGLSTINRGQHVGQAVQRPFGQVVDQRGVGLQLEAKFGKTLHYLQHQRLVERRLAAVEGDVHLFALQVLVHKCDQLLNVVFHVHLRAQHVAHTQ